MPDVTACLHPADVRLWVSLDVHKLSIVAATLPPDGGKPEVCTGSRRPSGRSAGSSTGSAAPRAWRSAMRRGPAGSSCGGC